MAFNLEDYFKTMFEEKLLVKMPEREDDQLTSATRLLEKRREMAEVERALAAQKEEFQMKMESLQQRREELEKKECQLKESLFKFDKFLKENDIKRARAVKKAQDERDLSLKKDQEIERLKGETARLVWKRNRLQERLNGHVIFLKYMEKVLELSDEFHELREISTRYDTLISTHQDLLESEQENQEKVEKQKQQLMKYTEEKNNEILSYNNQLAMLQTRLDKAQSEAVKWESKWAHIKNTAARKTLELGRVKMTTHNLYQLVRNEQAASYGGAATVSVAQEIEVDDTNEQLNKIRQCIEDLTDITAQLKEEKKEGSTGSFQLPSSSQ